MQGNGEDKLVVPGHTLFKIGGASVSVPPMTFGASEMLEKEMASITPGVKHNDYTNTVLKIVAVCIEFGKAGPEKDPNPEEIDKTFRRLKRQATISETLEFYDSLTELYRNSGFPMAATAPPENQPESEQPIQSTESSQTLQ